MKYIVIDSTTKEYSIGGTEEECDKFISDNINIYPTLIKVKSREKENLNKLKQKTTKTLKELLCNK